MSDPDYAAARELFFGYDGSHSYMSRDAVEDEYRAYGVPAEVEQRWFEALLEERLAGLHRPGNWRTVSFLQLHQRSEYLDDVAAAEPAGEWWEQCSFLEATLRYIEFTCRRFYPPERLAELCRSIARQALPLADSVPADQPPDRVDRLMQRARSLRSMLLAES